MGKWPATRAECWPIHRQILDPGRHLRRDMAWHDDRMEFNDTVERASSRVSVRRCEMGSSLLSACAPTCPHQYVKPTGVLVLRSLRRGLEPLKPGFRLEIEETVVVGRSSAVHCLGARAGLPYQVNDRLPRFAVCPVQLEGAATTPALLLPFPSPPLCAAVACWAATSICSPNDDTPDLEFPPGVPISHTCRPEACDFCHSTSTHTPRRGQFTCEREGSSQVLSRGSFRGQIAQGTYTIALCGGGTAEGYASLHLCVCACVRVCVCVCVSLLSLACLLGGSAVAHSTASCFLPLLLEKDFRPPKGVIPNAKQHWRQPSFLACIFNPPCATKVAF